VLFRSQPEAEPEPLPAPEPQSPEPPAPESSATEAPAPDNGTNQQVTTVTLQGADHTPEHESDPAQTDTISQPATHQEPPVTPLSEPVAEEVEPSTINDRVMYLALIADRSVGPTNDVPSTGLLLTLIWLGPALVILARTRLRHQAESTVDR